jgi:predicted membrane protein
MRPLVFLLVAVLFGVGFGVAFATVYPLVSINAGIIALCALAGCLAALTLQAALGFVRRHSEPHPPKP